MDAVTGEVVLTRDRDRGAWRTVDTDVAYDATGTLRFSILPDDPLSACQEFTLSTEMGRDGWRTRTTAFSRLQATASHFILQSRLEAYEGGQRVFARSWDLRLPRDNV